MALLNPNNPSVPDQDAIPSKEVALAQWQGPVSTLKVSKKSLTVIVVAAVLLSVGFGFLGYWFKDSTYYLAAVVAPVIAFSIITQNRASGSQMQITLTNLNIIVGNKGYPMADMAGFWLEKEAGVTAINIEPKKAAMLPITFSYPSENFDEVRQVMLQALPEVEPRQKNISDSINKYFKI